MAIPLLYSVFSFLTYEVSYSKKFKQFLKDNAEFIFAIGFRTVFCGTYFCDWLIQTVFCESNFCHLIIAKISSTII